MYMGIDPGKTGGWAIINEIGNVVACKEFTSFKDVRFAIGEVLGVVHKLFTVLEHVHSFPGQGVKSMFTFGQNYGGWQAALELLELPYELIVPKVWQKEIIGSVPKGMAKKYALAYAQKRWPELNLKKKDDGIADALCIALYAKRLEMGKSSET